MATNPIGKGSKTIGINMCKKMADDLEKRADSLFLEGRVPPRPAKKTKRETRRQKDQSSFGF